MLGLHHWAVLAHVLRMDLATAVCPSAHHCGLDARTVSAPHLHAGPWAGLAVKGSRMSSWCGTRHCGGLWTLGWPHSLAHLFVHLPSHKHLHSIHRSLAPFQDTMVVGQEARPLFRALYPAEGTDKLGLQV